MTDHSNENLSGKDAVITGSASGISLTLAVQAPRKGMTVALADVSRERLDEARQTIEAAGGETIIWNLISPRAPSRLSLSRIQATTVSIPTLPGFRARSPGSTFLHPFDRKEP